MSHNKGPFWKSNMESMVPRCISSSNIDYIHKTFCNVLLIVQMWQVCKKKCYKYSDEGWHFPSHISWLAILQMVINNMWYSLKYASIWMMILRNHFHKASVAEMWLDNKKYDWKLNFLVDFTSRFQEYPSATNMIVIWTWYSDSFTPKTSH